MHVYADVLTSANVWNSEQPLLTYSVPPGIQNELQIGQLIAVPYGDRLVEGIVWNVWRYEEGGDMTGHTEQPQTGQMQDQARVGQVDNSARQGETRTGQAPSLHYMLKAEYISPK